MAGKKFYAVRVGRVPGIYDSWDKCSEQVSGYPGAKYQGFFHEDEAKAFLEGTDLGPMSASRDVSGSESSDPEAVRALEYLSEHGYIYGTAYDDVKAAVHGSRATAKDAIEMFVDGSYNQDTGDYGYGVYILMDGKAKVMYGKAPTEYGGRNVEGEVAAATVGLEVLRKMGVGRRPITVYHDYEGVGGWADGMWKCNKDYTLQYARGVRELRSLGMDIEFRHVTGHTGVEGNEFVDVLAKSACGVPMTRDEERRLGEVLAMDPDAEFDDGSPCMEVPDSPEYGE